MTTRYEFEVKAKGRAVFPAGLRAACGFEPGTRLVARPDGPGRAIVETTDAVLERIWSGIPAGAPRGLEELAAVRAEQVQLQERRAEPQDGDDGSAERGAALLRALNLD